MTASGPCQVCGNVATWCDYETQGLTRNQATVWYCRDHVPHDLPRASDVTPTSTVTVDQTDTTLPGANLPLNGGVFKLSRLERRKLERQQKKARKFFGLKGGV